MYTVDDDNRMAWLDSLRPGDSVAVWWDISASHSRYYIFTVDSISAKRTKFTMNDNRFWYGADGYSKKGDKWTTAKCIEPVTDAVLAHNHRVRVLMAVEAFKDWGKLPLESLEQVNQLISIVKDPK